MEQLTCKSLMIGDWVRTKYGSAPFQILSIISKNVVSTEGFDIDIADLQPIPLTPEILEKNGFKKYQIYGEKQDDIFQCFDGETIIEVGIYDPNFISIRYRYETTDGVNSGELSSIVKVDGGKFYLHELQHALRLCGIEKEITIN